MAGDYPVARARMVREQLIDRGVTDERVLRAMSIVPRHLFVDPGFRPRAYGDHSLPIGCGQTISQPSIVGLMCQHLALPVAGGRVLEIGTGSGYQAAVLALMGQQVWTVERHPDLAAGAEALLDRLGIGGVSFRVGDGTLGWPEEMPFDGIVVAAGAPDIPADVIRQLTIRGRMVIPVGDRETQRLTVITRGEKFIEKSDAGACVFVPLIGERGWDDR